MDIMLKKMLIELPTLGTVDSEECSKEIRHHLASLRRSWAFNAMEVPFNMDNCAELINEQNRLLDTYHAFQKTNTAQKVELERLEGRNKKLEDIGDEYIKKTIKLDNNPTIKYPEKYERASDDPDLKVKFEKRLTYCRHERFEDDMKNLIFSIENWPQKLFKFPHACDEGKDCEDTRRAFNKVLPSYIVVDQLYAILHRSISRNEESCYWRMYARIVDADRFPAPTYDEPLARAQEARNRIEVFLSPVGAELLEVDVGSYSQRIWIFEISTFCRCLCGTMKNDFLSQDFMRKFVNKLKLKNF